MLKTFVFIQIIIYYDNEIKLISSKDIEIVHY